MTKALIVTTTPKVSALVELARTFASSVTALAVGQAEVAGVDAAVRIPLESGQPAEALAPAVGAAVKAVAVEAGEPVVVLAPDAAAERVLAAAAAVALGAPVFTGVRSVSGEAGALVLRRSLYGGIAEEDVTVAGSAVIIGDGGAACEGEAPAAEAADASGAYALTVTAEQPADGDAVDLAAALRVVGVGRGFEEKENLVLAEELAGVLGAEIGCTRPLCEGVAWMSTDRYIGISGVAIAPELYIAAGISGQIQHTAGIGGSKIIVAINDDPDSPIFEVADYGIVADLHQIVPALTKALAE